MLAQNNIAFKERAVVCAALASGRQTIILRKGGIDEGTEEFRVKYDEFWLLPTRFHQDISQLSPDARSLWESLQNAQPPSGKFLVNLYAAVEAVYDVRDSATLDRLADEHILSTETAHQRFQYRHPGLFVLVVRTYRIPTSYEVSDSPYIAGCISWVELPKPLATSGAVPVIDIRDFDPRVRQIRLITSGEVYPCPCCGFMVFYEAPGSFDICPICFWEDDVVQLGFPDLAGGANSYSLVEAQQNFSKFGACEERLQSHVRPPKPSEAQDPDWRQIHLDSDRCLRWGRPEDDRLWKQMPRDACLYYWKREYWLNRI